MTHLTTIDHIDIVVENPEKMAAFLTSIGFTFKRKTRRAGLVRSSLPGTGDNQSGADAGDHS